MSFIWGLVFQVNAIVNCNAAHSDQYLYGCEECEDYSISWIESEFILERKRFFIALSHAHFRFFFLFFFIIIIIISRASYR